MVNFYLAALPILRGTQKLSASPARHMVLSLHMIIRRLLQLTALLMIGDGVSGLLKPRWHSLLWDIGPDAFETAMETLAANPVKARALYAAEIAVGILLSTQLTPEKPGPR